METPLSSSTPDSLIYRIDAKDRISYVNTEWQEWARNNDGEAVMSKQVLGRELWACVEDSTVRQIYHRMVKMARDGKPVRFNYRCDAPAKRRVFEMTIRSVAGGEVEFVSTLVQEETRPPVALLELGRRRDERFLRICSWCQRVATPGNTWLPVEEAVQTLGLLEADPLPQITHGICEACAARYTEGLAELNGRT